MPLEISEQIENTKKNPENQIEYFKTEYNIKISAIIEEKANTREWWVFSYIELENLATSSINHTLNNYNNKNIDIISDLPHFIPNSNNPEKPWNYELYKTILEKLCKKSEKDWKTLILGFSSMWWYDLLPKISEIIKELKSKHKNLIFIIWWADFNALPDKIFLDRVFEYGIDIVNIWWAWEFIDFFWNIWDDDKFYRDRNWLLRIETDKILAKNIVFEHKKNDIWEINPWKKIETTYFYNDVLKQLHFTINNNPCLNNCAYCANFIHSSTPFRDSDVDKAIIDLNNYLSQIDEKVYLALDNPNPLQFIDKFERFITNIDLAKVKQIWMFGDFMWIWNIRIYNKTIEIIENLLNKYPEILITINFWIDAIHHKNDWEFVWRTIWQKIAIEEKYQNWFRNFDDFFNRYKNNGRIFFPTNIIFHPNMDIFDYQERFNFLEKYNLEKNALWLFTLDPHPNTQLEKTHKWYYIPEYEAVNKIPSIKQSHPNLNLWWHFYLNSSLLDSYVFSNNTWIWYLFHEIISNWIDDEYNEEFKEKVFTTFLKWNIQKLEKYLKKSNSLIWRIKFKERKLNLKLIKEYIQNSIDYIDFVILRESYIVWINHDYKTEKLDKFISDLEEYKSKFIDLKWNI